MKRFNQLIRNGVEQGYSDIHISGDHPVVCRKNGRILFTQTRFSCEAVDDLVVNLLEPHERGILDHRLSVDVARSVAHIRIRINVFYTIRGLSLAVRLLPGRIPSFRDLNLIPDLRQYTGMETGLILVCGPTGSGKSSTIAAFLSEINRKYERHIVCLEDPIEYRFSSKRSFIAQRELGTHIPSFDRGLQDVLREDPDVIMVGELREPETIRLTINAVESGHLVIASLHASNSEDALYRMCNAFPPDAQDNVRTQLSSVLTLLLVQRLEYKEEHGFRVPVLSILKGTQSVKATIRDNRFSQIESIIQTSMDQGMYTMEKYDSVYLAGQGKLTPPELSFKPSLENADIRDYRSPLMDRRETKAGDGPLQPGTIPAVAVPGDKSFSIPTTPREGAFVLTENGPLEEVISKLTT